MFLYNITLASSWSYHTKLNFKRPIKHPKKKCANSKLEFETKVEKNSKRKVKKKKNQILESSIAPERRMMCL